MNKSLSKRLGKPVLGLIILLVAILLGIYLETRPRLAPGQAPLADIQNIGTLHAQFNQDVGKTRLILLVSPT
jgi:hypothetical protein